MKSLTTLLLTLTSLGAVSPEHILMITLGGTRSHKIPFLALEQELTSKGYEVTLVSAFLPEKPSAVKDVSPLAVVEAAAYSFGKDMLSYKLQGKEPFTLWSSISYVYKVCVGLYSSAEMQHLLTQKVDLLILDSFYPDCLLGLSHHYHAPVILFNTVAYYTKPFRQSGGPSMYSVTPAYNSEYSDRMDFWERSWNSLYHIVHDITGWAVNRFLLEPLVRKHLGSNVPHTPELAKNVSLILQNGHHSVTHPRPFLPNVVEVGCIHCGEAKPLPKDLEAFVRGGNKKGFIYVNFGTSVRTVFPETLRLLMLNVFSKLPYQVLWKLEADESIQQDLPQNVRLADWLPQQDLLGHPRIQAFVNHGGLLSVLEAVYHGVPMVTIPIFCDHEVNSRKVRDDGYAIVLPLHNLTEGSLSTAIRRVIDDKRFKESAVQRSVLLRDQPEPPLVRALYWVQYVLRHSGAPHLQSAAKDLTLVQYFMLDTLGALAVTLIIFFVVMKVIFRKAFRRRELIPKVKTN